MKVRLQNHERFLEVGEYDTVSGAFKAYEKDGHSYVKGGAYSYCEDDLLAIFAAENGLVVKIGLKEIPIRSTISATLERYDRHNVLRIFDGKKEVFSYKYIPEKGITGDMTPFIDGEDDDFLLFIANIVNSPERQGVFWEVHGT